ncbi:hypothetical protein [Pseudoduganella sp. RAF53_2]|uniref:hypothetical protein n=1 Tax=unclassified Pseudoduganella TaxID=2637179 RepID=UPI003F9677F8
MKPLVITALLAIALPLGASTLSVSPIYEQLLLHAMPKGFVIQFEEDRKGQYIREAVLSGESVEHWTQMVTVTAARGLAVNAAVTPQLILGRIAQGFEKACPTTFSVQGLGRVQVTGAQDGLGAVISCGSYGSANTPHSETAVILSIKGVSDFYTIQWAERGPPSATPLPIDKASWIERLANLAPVKLCPIVPGEAPPYPSCVGD